MIRTTLRRSDALGRATTARLMNMRGRDIHGWPRIRPGDLRTDDQLAPEVETGAEYARSLPPKW